MSDVDWPAVRVAHKDGEFQVLWPGELATPFKRAGWEVRDYSPGGEMSGDTLRKLLLEPGGPIAAAADAVGQATEIEEPEAQCGVAISVVKAALDNAFPSQPPASTEREK